MRLLTSFVICVHLIPLCHVFMRILSVEEGATGHPKKSTIFPGYNKVGQYSTFMLGVPLRTRMNIFPNTRKVTSGWGGQLHHYHQDLRRASPSPEGSSSWAALASRPRPLSWQKFEPFSSL